MKIVVGINLSGNHNTRHNYENKNRTRHNALSHTSGNMVHLGFERDTGSGRLPYSGTDVYDISAIIRVRHTTIVLPPVLAYNPIYLVIGKIDRTYQQHLLLQTGLIIFVLSGLFYILSTEMWQLIAVSALLGIGSGLIVPLSTGLISRYFTGKYRTRQFGLSSAITNITLVSATLLTGYLAGIDWHLPFVVYFFPIVAFVFSFYLKKTLSRRLPSERTIPENQCKTPHRPYGILRAGNLSGCHHQF